MKLIVKTAPSSEPITLAEAKTHLRITHGLEDDYINLLIKVAREKFEKDTERVCVQTTYELYLDSLTYNDQFNCDVVLFKCPIISVDEVAVLADDTTSTYTPISSDTYKSDVKGEPGRILFSTFPDYGDQMNAIRITFKAGYAPLVESVTDLTKVPEQAKQAMKLLIGHFYENRQNVVTGTQVNEVPMTYQYLMEQFKYTL